jgi:hypothetical protein
MKLEHLRTRLLHAARSMPVPDHPPIGFESRVLRHITAQRRSLDSGDTAMAWLRGLRNAAFLAAGVAALALMTHVFLPAAPQVSLDASPGPDLLGEALLADVPGFSDEWPTDDPIP